MQHNEELKLTFAKSPAPAEIHTARSWKGVSVQYSRLKLPTEYEFRWDGESHYLAHHDLVLEDGEMKVLGERPIQGRDLRDQMTYVPQGQTITGWAKPADREANLASDIGLDDLAAVAVMTRFHFSRAFKATFGEPPYQFVIRRRIERARQLLAESRFSVADVAQACGFGNASQFTRTFRDIVGVPPLAFRKSI